MNDGIIVAKLQAIEFELIIDEAQMSSIHITEMIITCEACGNVKRFQVESQHDCDGILKNFTCENNCGRSLVSYFTIGSLVRETDYQISMDNMQLALAT